MNSLCRKPRSFSSLPLRIILLQTFNHEPMPVNLWGHYNFKIDIVIHMVILIKAAQLILSLSILVIIHEFGHFIFSKAFKCRVEKFYLFFNPWFSLFKFQRGETEYGVGWLPLGGYVKISGMIDESMALGQSMTV